MKRREKDKRQDALIKAVGWCLLAALMLGLLMLDFRCYKSAHPDGGCCGYVWHKRG
jgi:hypothetical protein